jgi:hypothetical protein
MRSSRSPCARGCGSLDFNDDALASSRYGLTLSIPLMDGVSVKLAWSTGLTTRAGGNFDTVGLALQYRWFDR